MYIQIEKTSREIKHCYPSTTKAFISYSWCGEFECEEDFFISRQKVGVVVAIYTISGCGEAIVNGRKMTLTKNTLAFFGGNDVYSYYPLAKGWCFRFVHLHGTVVDMLVDEIMRTRGIVFPFFDRAETFSKFIENVISCKNEKNASNTAYSLLLAAYYGEETKAENVYIHKVKQYVAENLAGDLSVEVLAVVAGFSRPYFTKIFTKETGKTPSMYVINERLKQAKRLIYTTDKSIAEIATECGYFDTASFIRLFKRMEGVTPLALRKSQLF